MYVPFCTICDRVADTLTGVEDSECREGNLVSSKLGAKLVLRTILDLPINEEEIPDRDFEMSSLAGETIVEATGVYQADGVEVEYD